jgi:small subunit ribosomal protein S4e
MARGPKKHMKRLNAPKHWMLDKMGGTWAPRPSTGPHKLRECLPLCLILRNRLKYALTKKECQQICMLRLVKVDGRVRTDPNFPCGFNDVISLDKTDEHFRMLFDVKGRYVLHRLNNQKYSGEMEFKLCRVNKLALGAKGIPYVSTHDGRTIRYPDPLVRVNDCIKVDLASGKMTDIIHFETGASCVVTKGKNNGRIGVIASRDKHPGGFDIITVRDTKGRSFATRIGNIFCIGKKDEANAISIPKARGIKENILDERKKRFGF